MSAGTSGTTGAFHPCGSPRKNCTRSAQRAAASASGSVWSTWAPSFSTRERLGADAPTGQPTVGARGSRGVRRGGSVRDEQSFDELVDACSPRLLRTAWLLTGDPQLAEDLLQTALAATYLRWGRLRDTGAAEAYVRKVMATTASKWWRRKWHGERPTEVLPEHAGTRRLRRRRRPRGPAPGAGAAAAAAARLRRPAVLRGPVRGAGRRPARLLGRHREEQHVARARPAAGRARGGGTAGAPAPDEG